MSTKNKYIFRSATKDDIKSVREMIQELADYEEMSDGPQLTEKDLITDAGLDGGKEYCHIYILECQQDSTSKPTAIVGYAICFFSYSTWKGKCFFLEDLYIRPDYRKLGAGKYLFQQILAKAKEYNCKRVEFHVLGWNPARFFYKEMGAIDITETEMWRLYRLNEEQIDKALNKLKN